MTSSPEPSASDTGGISHSPPKKLWLLIFCIATACFFTEIPSAKGRPFSAADPTVNHRDAGTNTASITIARKTENAYDKIILEAAHRHDVHPALIKAIIKAESSYNPRAVSRRGARGLMQLMPGTARAMGVKNSFNPKHNIHGGTKYFRHLLDQFKGNIRLALAAYNAGIERVRHYGRVPPYKETRSYINKVMSYYREYRSEMRMMARS
ncbi:lytic transglycosylase domain-containing protein [Desulfococcus sp.]|uniref:lytic transglycosylase domain-containing protein n=1 Tax=Desulfococcus sp. TaxID=2025834 RepID=UPI003D0E8FA3